MISKIYTITRLLDDIKSDRKVLVVFQAENDINKTLSIAFAPPKVPTKRFDVLALLSHSLKTLELIELMEAL
jgi:hypothetical protein